MTTDLAVFDEVRADINQYKVENANLVFDYESQQGSKDARSHIYKLRKTKKVIADIHKEAKAEALAVCQKIDKEKRDLLSDVEEMIEVHNSPLRVIDERIAKEEAEKAEADRLEKERIEQERLEALTKKEEELAAKEVQLRLEANRLEAEKRAETDAKRREQEAREQVTRQAENDKKTAASKAEQDKQTAINEERARVARIDAAKQAETERLAEADRKKRENEEHRTMIETQTYSYLKEIIPDVQRAYIVMENLRDGNIPNVTLNY